MHAGMNKTSTPRNPHKWGCITTRRNKDGQPTSLRASYQPPAGRRIYRDFPTRTQAETWLEGERRRVEAAEAGLIEWRSPTERLKPTVPTFAEWMERTFEHQSVSRSGRPLAPATMRKKRLARDRLVAHFGGKRLDRITQRDVRDWLKAPGFTGPEPLRIAYCTLRAALAEAANPPDGGRPLIERNPCVMPIPPKPVSKAVRIPPATPAQLAAIRAAMPARLALAIDLMAGLALRPGEACALTIGDLDLDALVCHVRHSPRRAADDRGELMLGDTKNRTSSTDMPIPAGMAGAIRDHIRRFCPDSGPDAMLFQPPQSKILNPTRLGYEFGRAAAKADRPDLVPHMLRVTAITESVNQGASPKDVQRFGRHATAAVSLEHYQRAHDATRQRQLADDVYGELMGGAETPAMLERRLRDKLAEARRLAAEIDRLNRRLTHVRRHEQR